MTNHLKQPPDGFDSFVEKLPVKIETVEDYLPDATRQLCEAKLKLYGRLSRLIPYIVFRDELKDFEKKMYKLYRSKVPHAATDASSWLKMI